MGEETKKSLSLEEGTSLEITREYIAKIFEPEQRKKEIANNMAEIEDRTKALETLMQKGGIEILKDLERLPQVIQGMKIFNRKIDEAEEQILVTGIRQSETKKSLHEIKRIKERVKDSIAGIEKVKGIIETTESLERISTKCMIKIDQIINQRRKLSEEEILSIFQWVSAYKRLSAISKKFSNYSFYSSMCLTLEQTEKRLVMTANLMTQWWICEITTGIPQIAESKKSSGKKEPESVLSEEIKESRRFALLNRDFVYVSKYIYEEIGQAEEFTDYINNARKRELIKLSKIPIETYSRDKRLHMFIEIFLEFFLIDRKIKSFVPQVTDSAVEEYDRAIKRKLDVVINSIPVEEIDNHYVFKQVRYFFLSVQQEQDMYFKELSEILIQTAYKCIDSEYKISGHKIKSIIDESLPLKSTLFSCASEIRKFFRESKMMIYEVEQIENELDDIILKCVNGLVLLTGRAIENASAEDALEALGFAKDLKTSIKEEMENHNHYITEKSLLLKLPEIEKIEHIEIKTVSKSEEELKKKIEAIGKEIAERAKRVSAESEVSISSGRVSETLGEFRKKVSNKVLQDQLDFILGFVLIFLPSLKVYRQVSLLEDDFAILYKSVQYLNLETPQTKNILKLFTEIDCIRKEKKKTSTDQINNDLNSLLNKYTKKKTVNMKEEEKPEETVKAVK